MIICSKQMPARYINSAYGIGTMRKILAICESEELLSALQMSRFHSFFNVPSSPTSQEIEKLKEVLCAPFSELDDKAVYAQGLYFKYDMFWDKHSNFKLAPLLQMIVTELQTNPNRLKSYTNNSKNEINKLEIIANNIA